MISFVLLFMAYFKTDIKFLRYSYIVLATRNVFSMHDFEGVMQVMQIEETKPLFFLAIMVVFWFV